MLSPARTRAIWIDALAASRAARGQTLWQLIAANPPQAPALIDAEGSLSYATLLTRAAAYTAWARTRGLAPGEVVGLMLPNSAEYVAAWLGLIQAGQVAALLNTNLTGPALAHSLRAASLRHVIAHPTYAPALEETAVPIELTTPAAVSAPAAAPPSAPPPEATALLIYTSGTTGLPKAARITHRRLVEWSAWFAGMMGAKPADRMYNCLPMYHSTGGVVAVGSMLMQGGAVVVAEKFSASRFWPEVAAQGCTIFQYIGELCRYLADAPAAPTPPHRLRLACGNGMAGDVWQRFQARFAIPRILEFYASTEGNISLYNVEQKPGAIGRIPPFLAPRFPTALLRCDAESGTPSRGADGLCQPVAVDEAGEAVGQILENADATAFDGYTDAAATNARVLRDVLTPGDAWFRTGDLMRKDAAGFFHFVDRLGDSFRWKGENVSAAEVASILMSLPGIAQAVVFGLRIPGHEGKAGMAALVPGPAFGIASVSAGIGARLASYARPLILRLCGTIDATATHKLKAEDLKRQGLAAGTDTLWLLRGDSYVPLTSQLRAELEAGELPR